MPEEEQASEPTLADVLAAIQKQTEVIGRVSMRVDALELDRDFSEEEKPERKSSSRKKRRSAPRKPRVEHVPKDYDGPLATISKDRDDPDLYGLWVPVEALDEPLETAEYDDLEWSVVVLAKWNKGNPRLSKVLVGVDSEDVPKYTAEFGLNEGEECGYVSPNDWVALSGKSVAASDEIKERMESDYTPPAGEAGTENPF